MRNGMGTRRRAGCSVVLPAYSCPRAIPTSSLVHELQCRAFERCVGGARRASIGLTTVCGGRRSGRRVCARVASPSAVVRWPCSDTQGMLLCTYMCMVMHPIPVLVCRICSRARGEGGNAGAGRYPRPRPVYQGAFCVHVGGWGACRWVGFTRRGVPAPAASSRRQVPWRWRSILLALTLGTTNCRRTGGRLQPERGMTSPALGSGVCWSSRAVRCVTVCNVFF
ncbi:hypothetical protein C8F04DRAFT_735129 [Mycena alexandri]|uniref:Uncharacterized protein n=1 Tax=Mycena alexandri TaxID=1745969 RepID=A0AAD6SN47_9AGAR|nr:hypothetical protein C8F04DRAFT_735129 [Mycena alexandri]